MKMPYIQFGSTCSDVILLIHVTCTGCVLVHAAQCLRALTNMLYTTCVQETHCGGTYANHSPQPFRSSLHTTVPSQPLAHSGSTAKAGGEHTQPGSREGVVETAALNELTCRAPPLSQTVQRTGAWGPPSFSSPPAVSAERALASGHLNCKNSLGGPPFTSGFSRTRAAGACCPCLAPPRVSLAMAYPPPGGSGYPPPGSGVSGEFSVEGIVCYARPGSVGKQ